MCRLKKYGEWALIAGGSEGIGAAYADALALEGIHLVLVARNAEKLNSFAKSIREKFKVEVLCVSCDLADPDASEIIIEQLDGRHIGLFVYNAGLSYIGKFEENSEEHHRQIMQINVVTQTKLVQALGSKMLAKGKGAIIIMASLAGMQGTGFITAYAATKAYNKVLAESLYYEWKERGVDVIACVAGATATPNYLNTKPDDPGLIKPTVQNPDQVVEECFKKLGKTPSFICGFGNKLASIFMHKLFPRKLAVKIMGDTTRKMYRLE